MSVADALLNVTVNKPSVAEPPLFSDAFVVCAILAIELVTVSSLVELSCKIQLSPSMIHAETSYIPADFCPRLTLQVLVPSRLLIKETCPELLVNSLPSIIIYTSSPADNVTEPDIIMSVSEVG